MARSQPQPQPVKPQTLAITNFSGRLTRILNGDVNSGFAKFAPSFGYDPFSKPMNLTWLETPTSVTGIINVPLAGKVLSGSITGVTPQGPNVHILDQTGNWYQILSSNVSNPNINSIISLQSVFAGNSFNYGASIEFFGSIVGTDAANNSLGKLYFSTDTQVKSINPNSSGESVLGTSTAFAQNIYHPLKPFVGKLFFGNGNTIGAVDNTGTITSSIIGTGINSGIFSEFNPPLPVQAKVLDMEVSPSNDYLLMATSNISQEARLDASTYDIVQTFGSQDGKIYQWNGSDRTHTAATSVPTYLLSAIKTYFRFNSFFAGDTFGAAFNDGLGKIISLPNNAPPLPNAVTTNANFMTWVSPETDSTKRYLSLYYYGSLDLENPRGLYRLLRWTTPQANGFVLYCPLNLLVSNKYVTVNGAQTSLVTLGYGKHYLGVNSVNSSGGQRFLLAFLITSTGTGTPQLGVYETQTQLFSKRIGVSQIRVYTEPTVSNNGFQLDMIGSDGNVIANGTFTYTYGDAKLADPNSNSLALERIVFNPNFRSQYALGVRITNTGTVNMTIKKIEIDYSEEGK